MYLYMICLNIHIFLLLCMYLSSPNTDNKKSS